MVHDIKSDPYYQTRRESTSQALLLDQLDYEVDYTVKRGYSEQQRFMDIRPIAFYYCLTYSFGDQFVPYLALTYHDRFLSRNIDIPNTHQVADERDVRKMEFLIKEGLEGRIETPTTALHSMIMGPLIFLLDMEDQQRYALLYYVQQTLYTINEDRVFNHEKCPLLSRRNVKREQGKELLIDDYPTPYKYLPNHEHPLKFILEDYENFIDTFREERQNQEHRSEIMEENEDQEDTFEITEEEVEETEVTSDEALGLDHYRTEPELGAEPETELESESEWQEEERYGLLQRICMCFCPLACMICFGYEIGRG
ncbi:hypothetical protein L1887_25427 [Cichorium endivia]|nr:hypothetical protein L1887_25427 [Cichorium endivia]